MTIIIFLIGSGLFVFGYYLLEKHCDILFIPRNKPPRITDLILALIGFFLMPTGGMIAATANNIAKHINI